MAYFRSVEVNKSNISDSNAWIRVVVVSFIYFGYFGRGQAKNSGTEPFSGVFGPAFDFRVEFGNSNERFPKTKSKLFKMAATM